VEPPLVVLAVAMLWLSLHPQLAVAVAWREIPAPRWCLGSSHDAYWEVAVRVAEPLAGLS